jgi:hypothetical protein
VVDVCRSEELHARCYHGRSRPRAA